MSRFLSEKYRDLTPYTPGEQPKVMNVVKLNTNECPFPPSERAKAYALAHTRELNLYPELAPDIARFAYKEGLTGHARSALIRLEEEEK